MLVSAFTGARVDLNEFSVWLERRGVPEALRQSYLVHAREILREAGDPLTARDVSLAAARARVADVPEHEVARLSTVGASILEYEAELRGAPAVTPPPARFAVREGEPVQRIWDVLDWRILVVFVAFVAVFALRFWGK
jgi:hypothetical protein